MIFNLEGFAEAQDSCYETVLAELRNGLKRMHWMWFVFPQIVGLGHSETARYFAISGLDEANAYFSYPILGERLSECTRAVLRVKDRTLHQIFGNPDDWKFRSSMTLFEYLGPDEALFAESLDRYCDGKRDHKTLEIIREQSS